MHVVGMVQVADGMGGLSIVDPSSMPSSAKATTTAPCITAGGTNLPSPTGPLTQSPRSSIASVGGTPIGSPIASRKGRLERSGDSSKKMRRECRSASTVEKTADAVVVAALATAPADDDAVVTDATAPVLDIISVVAADATAPPDVAVPDVAPSDIVAVAADVDVDVVGDGICGGGGVGGYHSINPSLNQPQLTVNTAFSTSGSISQSSRSTRLEAHNQLTIQASRPGLNHQLSVPNQGTVPTTPGSPHSITNPSGLFTSPSLTHSQNPNHPQPHVPHFPHPMGGSPRTPRTPRGLRKASFGMGLPTIQDVSVGGLQSSAHNSNRSNMSSINNQKRGSSVRHGGSSPTAGGVSVKRKGLQDLKNNNSRRKASVFFPTVTLSPFMNGSTGNASTPQRQTSFANRMGHLINFNLSGSSSSSKSAMCIDNNPSSAGGVDIDTKRSKDPSYRSAHYSQKPPKALDIRMLMNWRFSKLNVDEQIVIRIAAIAGIYT